MKHSRADDATKEMAALYALGALSQLEAAAFDRHLVEGCETCRVELRVFDTIVADLGLAAPQSAPPSGLRQRLLSSLDSGRHADPAPAASAEAKPPLLTIR